MKNYFKNLKNHSGWGTSLFVTILGVLAGASNKSFEFWWYGAIFGGVFGFLFCLSVILLTNGKE